MACLVALRSDGNVFDCGQARSFRQRDTSCAPLADVVPVDTVTIALDESMNDYALVTRDGEELVSLEDLQ